MWAVSIFGIVALLTLQFVWWRNAYQAVERDFMSTVQKCFIQSTDKIITTRLDGNTDEMSFTKLGPGIKVDALLDLSKMGKLGKGVKVFPKHKTKTSAEFQYSLEEALNMMNRPVTEALLDSGFRVAIKEKLGFVPKFDIMIHRQKYEIDSLQKLNCNRFTLGSSYDTIYHQIGYKAYSTMVIPSPIGYYIKKGAFILIVSVILVLMVCSIMIIQFIGMQRERKFANFIIDYTRLITHDLRTPVTGTKMIFEVLENTKPTQKKLRSAYHKEGINLTKKILLNLDNILYMAKSEQMELPVFWMEVDMRTYVDKIANSYRERNYSPKILTLETRYEPANFCCRMDTKLMENTLCNLLDNAIKYTDVDTRIVIACSKVDDMVEIKVIDNGMGMSPADQKRIFELFERGAANMNQMYAGFGIGLHFVDRVVKAHGGKVSVQSQLGKGTEFTIRYTSK